jgi:hypothetical protein
MMARCGWTDDRVVEPRTNETAEDEAMKTKKTVVDIVRANPGLNALELKEKGWREHLHGSLREAEIARLIVYRDEGWYPAPLRCIACDTDENVRTDYLGSTVEPLCQGCAADFEKGAIS